MAERFGIVGEIVFRRRLSSPLKSVALADLERKVRDRFRLEEESLVLVTEDRGRSRAGPSVTTTVLFWDADGARRRIRLFKPAAEVERDDLPPGWLRGALLDDGEADCC